MPRLQTLDLSETSVLTEGEIRHPASASSVQYKSRTLSLPTLPLHDIPQIYIYDIPTFFTNKHQTHPQTKPQNFIMGGADRAGMLVYFLA